MEWRSAHNGMQFLAGRYRDLGGDEPAEYLCGEHWHRTDQGLYAKGPTG